MFGWGLKFAAQTIGGSAPFDIASTNPSAYYDRTNLATLFQDSAGTTPVTAGSQPIGLGLDQSQGLELGPELVTNGDFGSGDTGWTLATGWSVSGGKATANTTLNAETLDQFYAGENNKSFEVTADITMLATPHVNAAIAISIGGAGENVFLVSKAGLISGESFQLRGILTPKLVYGAFSISIASNLNYAMNYTVDNISIRKIAGNHQSQADAGKRPIADGSPIYANFDAVDDELVTTFPASLGAGCTVCRSLPGTGASITTGVTLTATYTDNVDAHALLIYTAAQWAALDAGQIANITTWLNGRAGL